MKMRGVYITAITIFLLTAISEAKSQKSSIEQSTTAIEVRVVYGDKTNTFSVRNHPTLTVLHFSNYGKNASNPVSLKDYQFIKAQIKKLTPTQRISQNCPREFIEFKMGTKTYHSCLRDKSVQSKNMKETANLLAIRF